MSDSRRGPRNPQQFGAAGRGLGSESAKAKFGQSAAVGAAGERYFAQALERAGLTRQYDVWYSLSIPSDPSNPGATRYRSDVDVALTSGNRLVLVDVKKWASGHFYWSLFGLPFKGLSPMTKNGEWRLSANMAAAVARYRANLPGIQVHAIVVFVPTTKNGALPTGVSLLKWPGGIRSYLANDGIRKIAKLLGKSEPTEPRLRALMGKMVR